MAGCDAVQSDGTESASDESVATVTIDRTPLVLVPRAAPFSRDRNYRLEHGLRADEPFVRSLHRRKRSGDPRVVNAFSIVMLRSERAGLRRFGSLAAKITPAAEERVRAAGGDDAIAGQWLDQAERAVRLYTIGIDPEVAERIEAELSVPAVAVQIPGVAWTSADIVRVGDDIFDNRQSLLADHGVDVRGVGDDVRNFAVRVEVKGNLPHAADVLAELYPEISLIISPAGRAVDHAG